MSDATPTTEKAEETVDVPLTTTHEGKKDDKPLVKFRELLKVPYEMRSYYSHTIGTVFGLFPIDGSPPRFQGQAVAKAKVAGPFPEVEVPFTFDIVDATTPAEAFAKFEEVCNMHAPAAKQAAAKEWHRRYAGQGQIQGMQRAGLLDAMGQPIQKKMR